MTVVITWIVACIAIISVGVFAGRGMKGEGQWSGEDRSMSMWSLAFIFGGFQIGGMAIVGAAQNGYTMGIAGAWYSIAGSCYLLALAVVGRFLHKNMPGISVPLYLSQRYGLAPSRLYSYVWIIYGFLYIPMQLITICSIINIVLPQLPTAPAMLVGITLGALYTSFAGLQGAAAVGRVCCIGICVVLVIFNGYRCFREAYLIGGEHPHEELYSLQNFLQNNFSNMNYARLEAASILVVLGVFAVGLLLAALWKWMQRRQS